VVDGKRVADAFLERNARHLADEEREWIEAQGRAWLSIFEIVKVERGTVAVRDLLTGHERSVHEELASETLVVRDVVLARILEFRGTPLFGGLYGRSLGPSDAAEVVDTVRAKLRMRKRDIPIERLQNSKIGWFLIDAWADAVDDYDERRSMPPRLHNTDGDPLLFVTDSFRFEPANRPKIEKRLAALDGARVLKDDIVFLRPSDETVLGRVMVGGDTLRIETNSEKRADALRRTIGDACAVMLLDENRELQAPPPLGAAAALAGAPSPDDDSAEEQALLREYKEQHYRKWFDQPIPEHHLPEGARFDVRRLRHELGLKE
jgi:hypothetical protein